MVFVYTPKIFSFAVMEKCTNKKCPIKINCERFVVNPLNVTGSREFSFTEVKNPDGSIRGHYCQFQKYTEYPNTVFEG